ncbi:MAG: thiolase family protein [Actinobacteria bacterium]|nr:thiolase family protein [Actinomycetota bacterium]MCG2817824.1 thiolase family protein [Actinomycetes bacterium]MBU4178428.1 thiolase family protein [Actinomycetota bacterium]MBU4217445.1 thiolase family protein [Actinomycetota bacterium]MBU4359395.1 thiolase family protein [Actinomycetota bacterium]
MEKQVAIVGYAQTGYGSYVDASREILVLEAAAGALRSAGISREVLDTVVTATNDYMDGRTISNMRLVEPSGAWFKDESKVEMDGAYAVLYAMMRILSGDHDVAMVIGASQASVYPTYIPGVMMLDPTFDRERWLLNEVSAGALQARAYMDAYGATEEQIAGISVKNLRNAAGNPLAVRRMPVLTVDDVMDSRMLYSPIRELNAFPPSDGACSVILASSEKAEQITDNPVWIHGVGFSHDSYLTERPLDKLGSLKQAADRAYAAAGISDAKDQVDVAEVHENFSHEELMAYEALGFCGEGRGSALLESGATKMNGELPVNPSGGALAANAACAAGLARIAEAALQVRGEAGSHQVKGVKTALAHGQTGLCAQENIVFILGGE